MIEKLNEIKNISYEILYNSNCIIDYNVIIIIQVKKF